MNMSMKGHYFFLSSRDSEKIYKQNNANDFIVELPVPLELDGRWECGLMDIQLSPTSFPKQLYVFCDLCNDSYVSNNKLPILRRLLVRVMRDLNITFTIPYYMPIRRTQVKRIRIFIRDSHMQPVTFKRQDLKCTLHIRQVL